MYFFRSLVVISVFSKQGSENSPKYLWFIEFCNKNLLKIVKTWAPSRFWRVEYVTMKFWKVAHLYKSFGIWLNQPSLSSPKACKGMAYWLHRKYYELKRAATFEWLVESKVVLINLVLLVKKYFYHITKQPQTLTRNATPLNIRYQWYGHQPFNLFDLNENFPKLT